MVLKAISENNHITKKDLYQLEAIKKEVAKLEKAILEVEEERKQGKTSFVNYYTFLKNIKEIID